MKPFLRIIAVIAGASAASLIISSAFGQIGNPIVGWLWGGTTEDALTSNATLDNGTGLGWVSFSGLSPTYAVTLPPSNCTGAACAVIGYAWSSNLGWIRFDQPGPYPTCAGCPTTSVLRTAGNQLAGWARIVSFVGNSNVGNWSGWLRLGGQVVGGQPYSVNINTGANPNLITGNAWSEDLGWVQINAEAGEEIPPPPPPPATTLTVTLSANPSSSAVPPLNNVDLTADVGGTASGLIKYSFDCTNDGTFEVVTPNTLVDPYTAVDACSYAASGIYTARVLVERGGLQANEFTTITVGTLLSVSCAGVPSSGRQITWSATPSGGTGSYTFSWSFPPDGSPAGSSANPVTVTYATNGQKTATIQVTSGSANAQTTCSANATQFKLKEIPPFF